MDAQDNLTCAGLSLISECVKHQSKDLQDLFAKIKIQNCVEELTKFEIDCKNTFQDLHESHTKHIQMTREQCQRYAPSWMKLRKVLGKGEDMLKSWHKSLENCIQNCKKFQSQLRKLSEATKALNDDSREELYFIASQKYLDKIEQSREFLEKNTVKVESLLYDQSNSCMKQYLTQLAGLKMFVQRTSLEISVQIPSDLTVCDIRDICVFPDGQILLADNTNSKLKLLNKQYQIITHFDVEHPRGICLIKPGQLAIFSDNGFNRVVQEVKVKHGTLSRGGKFRLKHLCRGIAHHQEMLYVTSGNALYRYTLRGHLESMMYEPMRMHQVVIQCTSVL